MKIKEITEYVRSYVHPDIEKQLKKYEKRAKGRKMGFHPMMAYPYIKNQSIATIQKVSHKRLIVQVGRKNNG